MKSNKNKSSRKLVVQPHTTKVSAGTMSDAAAVVRKTFDTLLKGIDNVLDIKGWKMNKEGTEMIDGEEWYKYAFQSGTGEIVYGYISVEDDAGATCNLIMEYKGKRKPCKHNPIKITDVNKYITEFMDKYNLGSNEGLLKGAKVKGRDAEKAEASTRVLVKLQRVTGSTSDTIELLAINANCNIVVANDIVEEVLDNDEFVDQIGEEAQTFEIVETEDSEEYDVNPTDEEAISDDQVTYTELFSAAVKLHSDLQAIHWGAKGQSFYELHNQIDSLLWTSQHFIDTTAELLVEKCKVVPHVALYYQTDYKEEIENFIEEGFDFERGITYARTLLQDFVRVLECSYVNLDHDVQHVVDDWIRDLKKKADYFIDRQLLGSEPRALLETEDEAE